MSSSRHPASSGDNFGMPAGLSREEAGLYVNGLTETCAALRRRIAELESENRALKKGVVDPSTPEQATATATAAAAGELMGEGGADTGAGAGAGDQTLIAAGRASPQDTTTPASPPGVDDGGGGVLRREEDGNKSGGRKSSRRARVSWVGEKPNGGAETPTSPAARVLDESATRRMSSVPTRVRHSMGVSRLSLPPNLSPPKAFAGEEEGIEGLPRNVAGAAWEGLMLTHTLTGDEKNLAFMEFAVVGLSPSTLSGSQSLRPWGQDPQVISGFPDEEGDVAGAGRGKADGSFVQGLGDFCFPRGVSITLVGEEEEEVGIRQTDDRLHLVQFTDCENVSTYGCCVTVTDIIRDPSPRLVKRLQEREQQHAAARTLQRFMRSTCCRSAARRQADVGGGDGYCSASPAFERGKESTRIELRTPPPHCADSSAVVVPTDASVASDNSPTSFSMMMHRLFASNPGAESGETRRTSNPAAERGAGAMPCSDVPMATPARSSTPVATAGDDSPVRSVPARESGSPPSAHATAAGRTFPTVTQGPGTPLGDPSRSSTVASPTPKRRAPSSPGPTTRTSSHYAVNAGRSRSAGLYRGGSARGYHGDTSLSFPGMFSDDESDSDAVSSTDRDVSFSGDDDDGVGSELWAGGTERRGNGRNSVVEGQVNFPFRGHQMKGSCVGEAGETEVPPGLTVRNRKAYPRAIQAPAAAPAAVAPEEKKLTSSVLVEKCYVMISCHRNHSLMFKVLKAVADAERSSHQGIATAPPPRHASSRTRGGNLGSLSPPRIRSLSPPPRVSSLSPPPGARSGSGIASGRLEATRELTRSSTKFSSVASSAAEVAKKGRRRRMLRDKFLRQIRTDKSCTEELKKVSVHCPTFLRAPLELAPTSLEMWSTAVLFGCVSEETVLRALGVLLLEKTLVVCGRDLGLVSTVATALLSLLDPFKWEGVFVPVVPLSLIDVLDSPVPALVGVQAPFDKLGYAFDDLVVLDLDAAGFSGDLLMASMDEKLPVPEELVGALTSANTLRGRGRGADGRSPAKKRESDSRDSSPKAPSACAVGNGFGGSRGGHGKRKGRVPSSSGRRSHFAFQATTFMTGLTTDEKGAVVRLRSLVKGHVSSLCGDLGVPGMWQKYGAFNSATRHFEFHPEWFTEPLEERLRFQESVVRTQMFDSFVERCRQEDQVAEEEFKGHEMPSESSLPAPPPCSGIDRGGGSRGLVSLPPCSARIVQAPSDGANLMGAVAVKGNQSRASDKEGVATAVDMP